MSTGTLSTVTKAVRILELFRTFPELGASECSRQLRIPRSSAHRILVTLALSGVLERTTGGKYQVGLRLFEIGALSPQRRMLYDSACLPLERTVDAFGMPAQLAVREGSEALLLFKAHRAPHDRSLLRPGSRCPLHASALGKVLLAGGDDELVEQVIGDGLTRHTEFTVTRGARLRAELEQVRDDGFAQERQELRLGVVSVAVPVRDSQRHLIAAISVSAPSERFYRHRMNSLVSMLQGASAAIGKNLEAMATPIDQAAAQRLAG